MSDQLALTLDVPEVGTEQLRLNPYERRCRACGAIWQGFGPDPCLGFIGGVEGACCGHGDTRWAYVIFRSGARLDGRDAAAFFERRQPRTEEVNHA